MIEYGLKISAEGFTKGTWGNISVRDGEYVYITPSGIPYDVLEVDDVCVLSMNGDTVYARKKPSSEYMMHLEIYKARPDVHAIVHTHPVFSTVVSICLKSIPPVVEDAVMILGEELQVSDYALPGTIELACEAVKALGKNNCVFLKNHGLVTVGETIHEAFVASQLAEKTAQIYIEALKIGNVSVIPYEHARVLREKYLSSYRQK
ncbi:aldolase [Fervidobacterium thailandense]|uniref:Aldolase n=1 Tax=Fervidobacterium thailandense TaxID=1008305 RepID=A0A1E3G242_9BACT|nr:aldolase [Fervidobacterium thailandense]